MYIIIFSEMDKTHYIARPTEGEIVKYRWSGSIFQVLIFRLLLGRFLLGVLPILFN